MSLSKQSLENSSTVQLTETERTRFHRFQKQKGSFTGGAKGEGEECYSDAEEEAKERG